jgi:acetylornithine deacetylase/succinyl-diaminopimelate desuccinylase-like protein
VADLPRPGGPRSACSVVGLAGGSSLNSIPGEARVEIDLRSEAPSTIDVLEAEIRERSRGALERENARRAPGTAPLEMTIDVIGDRPSGAPPPDHPLVQAGMEATRAIGRQPALATA